MFVEAPRLGPVLVSLGLLVSACTTGEGSAVADSTESADSVNAQLAAIEFVSSAANGSGAVALLATNPLPDDQQGAPYDADRLEERLADLQALGGSFETIELGVLDDGGSDLGPSCSRSSGIYCQVDLRRSNGQAVASVIVYWFGDGVTGFSIVNRSEDGTARGIGDARCSAGHQLLHGGHAVDRFDIAVCVDDSGRLEYNGKERGSVAGLTLTACPDNEKRWVARNGGHQYIVDGSGSDVRSYIEVIDPAGARILRSPFTSVDLVPPAKPASC